MEIIASNLEKHVKFLTDNIGVRLAGSIAETKAAEYIAKEFSKYSDNVTIEKYPVMERVVTFEKLEVKIGENWLNFPCSLFGSANTTNGEIIEAELEFFDSATGYQREDLSFLTNKAVVHLGCHIESEDNYRRLMAAKPAFILFVDTRYPSNIQLADGLFPAYVKKYGSVPSLNVAYMDVWKWLNSQAVQARICVVGEIRPSQTTVVICEIKGESDSNEVIYAGGHHDTQAGTVGADDNAIGSAIMIELARLLSQQKHKRTFRLISFGAEEQLSVGSAAYIRNHRQEITENGIFMCNFDSMGSALGWYDFTINGNQKLRELLKQIYNKHNIFFIEQLSPCPYTDQFPFAACGVPGIWLYRPNCASGLYYHHRVDNTPDVIDFRQSAVALNASMEIMSFLANVDDARSYRYIPSEMQQEINTLFNAVYGGF